MLLPVFGCYYCLLLLVVACSEFKTETRTSTRCELGTAFSVSNSLQTINSKREPSFGHSLVNQSQVSIGFQGWLININCVKVNALYIYNEFGHEDLFQQITETAHGINQLFSFYFYGFLENAFLNKKSL